MQSPHSYMRDFLWWDLEPGEEAGWRLRAKACSFHTAMTSVYFKESEDFKFETGLPVIMRLITLFSEYVFRLC